MIYVLGSQEPKGTPQGSRLGTPYNELLHSVPGGFYEALREAITFLGDTSKLSASDGQDLFDVGDVYGLLRTLERFLGIAVISPALKLQEHQRDDGHNRKLADVRHPVRLDVGNIEYARNEYVDFALTEADPAPKHFVGREDVFRVYKVKVRVFGDEQTFQ